MSLRAHLAPVFWLVLPVLALNLVFAAALPAGYQPETFQDRIPAWLSALENSTRVALFALTAVLPIGWRRHPGWALYALGLVAYSVAWTTQILAPDAGWSSSAAGFTAPAWTAALWLAGVGLIAQPPVFSAHPGWKTAFWLLGTVFVAAHVSHAALVFTRLG